MAVSGGILGLVHLKETLVTSSGKRPGWSPTCNSQNSPLQQAIMGSKIPIVLQPSGPELDGGWKELGVGDPQTLRPGFQSQPVTNSLLDLGQVISSSWVSVSKVVT